MAPNDPLPKNEQLLFSIIQSVNPTNINWDAVARDLGCTKNAASLRWFTYRKKLPKDSPVATAPSTPRKGGNGVAAKRSISGSGGGTKKPLFNGTKSGVVGNGGRAGMKRKLKFESEDEKEDDDENGFEGDETDDDDVEPRVKDEKDEQLHIAKKIRRSPGRSARAVSYAEDETENEDEDEKQGDEENGQEENGHGGEENEEVYEDADDFEEA